MPQEAARKMQGPAPHSEVALCAGGMLKLEDQGGVEPGGKADMLSPTKGLAGVRCSPTTPSPQLPHQGQMPAWRQQLLHSDTVSTDGSVPEVRTRVAWTGPLVQGVQLAFRPAWHQQLLHSGTVSTDSSVREVRPRVAWTAGHCCGVYSLTPRPIWRQQPLHLCTLSTDAGMLRTSTSRHTALAWPSWCSPAAPP